MEHLYIVKNGQRIELELDKEYGFDIREFGREISNIAVERSDYSYQIVLVPTSANKTAIEFIDEDAFYESPYYIDGFESVIQVDGNDLANGRLYFEDATRVGINMRFIGLINEFTSKIKSISIRDLDWSPKNYPKYTTGAPSSFGSTSTILDHIINYSFIQKDWTLGETKNIYGQYLNRIFHYIPTYQGQYGDWFNSKKKVGTRGFRDSDGYIEYYNRNGQQDALVRTDRSIWLNDEENYYHLDSDLTEDTRIDFDDKGEIGQYYGEYRSYAQRAVIRVSFLLDLIKNYLATPAGGSWNLILDPYLFGDDSNDPSVYIKNLWMSLPRRQFNKRELESQTNPNSNIELSLPPNFTAPGRELGNGLDGDNWYTDNVTPSDAIPSTYKDYQVCDWTNLTSYDIDLQVTFTFSLQHSSDVVIRTDSENHDACIVNGFWIGVYYSLNGTKQYGEIKFDDNNQSFMFICSKGEDKHDSNWDGDGGEKIPFRTYMDYPVPTGTSGTAFRKPYIVYADWWDYNNIGNGTPKPPGIDFTFQTYSGNSILSSKNIVARGVVNVSAGSNFKLFSVTHGNAGTVVCKPNKHNGGDRVGRRCPFGFAFRGTVIKFSNSNIYSNSLVKVDDFLIEEGAVSIGDLLIDFSKLFGLVYKVEGKDVYLSLRQTMYSKNTDPIDITPYEVQINETKVDGKYPDYRYGVFGQKQVETDFIKEYKTITDINYGDVEVDINSYSNEKKDMVRTTTLSEVLVGVKYKSEYFFDSNGKDFRILPDLELDGSVVNNDYFLVYIPLKSNGIIELKTTDKKFLISDDPKLQYDGITCWTDDLNLVRTCTSYPNVLRIISGAVQGLKNYFSLDFGKPYIIYDNLDYSDGKFNTLYDVFWKSYYSDVASTYTRLLSIVVDFKVASQADLMSSFILYRSRLYVVESLTNQILDRVYNLNLRRVISRKNYTDLPADLELSSKFVLNLSGSFLLGASVTGASVIGINKIIIHVYSGSTEVGSVTIEDSRVPNVPSVVDASFSSDTVFTKYVVEYQTVAGFSRTGVTNLGFNSKIVGGCASGLSTGSTSYFTFIEQSTTSAGVTSQTFRGPVFTTQMISYSLFYHTLDVPIGSDVVQLNFIPDVGVYIGATQKVVPTATGFITSTGYSISPKQYGWFGNIYNSSISGYSVGFCSKLSVYTGLYGTSNVFMAAYSPSMENAGFSVGSAYNSGMISTDGSQVSLPVPGAISGSYNFCYKSYSISGDLYTPVRGFTMLNAYLTRGGSTYIYNGIIQDDQGKYSYQNLTLVLSKNADYIVESQSYICIHCTDGSSWFGETYDNLSQLSQSFIPICLVGFNTRDFIMAGRVGSTLAFLNTVGSVITVAVTASDMICFYTGFMQVEGFTSDSNFDTVDLVSKYAIGESPVVIQNNSSVTILDSQANVIDLTILPVEGYDDTYFVFYDQSLLDWSGLAANENPYLDLVDQRNNETKVTYFPLVTEFTKTITESFNYNTTFTVNTGVYLQNLATTTTIPVYQRFGERGHLTPTITLDNSNLRVTSTGLVKQTYINDDLNYILPFIYGDVYQLYTAASGLKYKHSRAGVEFLSNFLHAFIFQHFAFNVEGSSEVTEYPIYNKDLYPFTYKDVPVYHFKSNDCPYEFGGITSLEYPGSTTALITFATTVTAIDSYTSKVLAQVNGIAGSTTDKRLTIQDLVHSSIAKFPLTKQTVVLDPHAISIVRGGTGTITAVVTPPLDGTDVFPTAQTLKWESDNTSFATVTPAADTLSATVTLLSNAPSGVFNCIIKATLQRGTVVDTDIYDVCTVTLVSMTISVTPVSQSIAWGGSGSVTATISPTITPTPAVVWSVTSGPGSVSGSGLSATISMPNQATLPTVVRCSLAADNTIYGEASASPRP